MCFLQKLEGKVRSFSLAVKALLWPLWPLLNRLLLCPWFVSSFTWTFRAFLHPKPCWKMDYQKKIVLFCLLCFVVLFLFLMMFPVRCILTQLHPLWNHLMSVIRAIVMVHRAKDRRSQWRLPQQFAFAQNWNNTEFINPVWLKIGWFPKTVLIDD